MAGKKKDVLDDDGDEGLENQADNAAADKIRSKAKEAAEDDDDAPERDDPVEVDLDKAEDELEPANDEARETRRDRRRNRWREMQDERAAAVRRAEEAERRETSARDLLLKMQQHIVPQQQPPREREADPLDQELDQVFEEQRLLYAEHNARLQHNQVTPDIEREFKQKSRALQRKMLKIGGRLALAEQGPALDPESVKRQVVQEQMRQAHGDVLGNENTRMYCDGVWRQLRAKGKPDSWETLEEAAELTRREFGLASRSRRPPPSDATKRRLTGMSRGGGGSSSGSEGARVVTLTPEHKKMANAMYKHLPNERERYQRWAAGPGKRLLEKRA